MASFVDPIDLNLINSIVNCTKIFIIRCRTYTVYMWTEVTLCDTSKSFMKYTIHNTAKTSIFMCMYNRYFAIVISRNIKITTVHICSKETASHAVNSYTVNSNKVSVLVTFEYRNTLVLNRIQILTVFGNCCVRCIADVNFASFDQFTILYIYIINLNALTGTISVCTHIGHIFLVPHYTAS